MICECYRFDDDCSIKHKFQNNKMILKNGIEWELIQRFASMSGVERHIKENEDHFQQFKVAILPANDIETVEGSECAKVHRELLNKMYKKNKNPHLCIHCTKPIGEEFSLLVEIDEVD